MMEVGFQLYNEMLAEAVRALKAGKEPDLLSPLSAATEINLQRACPAARCILRRRAHASVAVQAARVGEQRRPDRRDAEEVTDRFGKLPPQGQTLFDVHRLRVLAKPFGVTKIDAAPRLMVISFRPNRRSMRCASSSWCRRTATSSSPATTGCASSATRPSRKTGRRLIRDVLRSLGTPKEPQVA